MELCLWKDKSCAMFSSKYKKKAYVVTVLFGFFSAVVAQKGVLDDTLSGETKAQDNF